MQRTGRGTGTQLRAVLEFLRERYPTGFVTDEIVKNVNLDQPLVLRLLAYALDSGWVTITGASEDIRVGPYRLTSSGIDKLNSWADEDDRLGI